MRQLYQYNRFELFNYFNETFINCLTIDTREILDAMTKDSGIALEKLLVDGGMCGNNLLMQLQADIAGVEVGECCKFNTGAHHSPTLVKGNCPLSLLVRLVTMRLYRNEAMQ